ncbi:hypothetical protein BASA62_004417 [Batrachochytrium salamandrivorans]|nr:hypothetical protein BASA62_004417 [Batrachochytrium salamandrivorans]
MLGRIFALARTVLPKLLSAIGLQRHAPASNTATVMSSAMTASAATKTASSFVRPLLSASPLAHWPLLASSRVQQPLYRIPPLSTRYGPSLFYAYASHHTFSWAAALDPKVRRQASIAILLRSLSQPKPKQFGLGPESDLNISSVSSIAPTTDTPLKPYAPPECYNQHAIL